MREIKFRFWDLDTKNMIKYPIEGITQHPLGRSLSTNITPLIRISGDICQPHWGKHCITMQYTGLKDKNGKEIYLFDFIKDKSGIIMLIVWREDLASFALRNDSWTYDHYFGEAVDSGNVEIIGNKFENPELL